MAVEAAGTNAAVTGAIRHASRVTGTNFQYLVATAQVESRFNPGAAAPTSSARGLFQFIEQTWLATLKEQGPALGYGQVADAIDRAPSGQYVVTDPRLNDRIMKLRNDPTANAVMAGAYTKANAAARRAARPQPHRRRTLCRAFPWVEGRRPADFAGRVQAGARADEAFPSPARPIRRSSTTRDGRAASPKSIACWSTATPSRARTGARNSASVAAFEPAQPAAAGDQPSRRTRPS